MCSGKCGNVDVKAAVGIEDMFVGGCKDLIPFVEFGRWCWCDRDSWDSVALYVFEVELSPEWSVVAKASQKC